MKYIFILLGTAIFSIAVWGHGYYTATHDVSHVNLVHNARTNISTIQLIHGREYEDAADLNFVELEKNVAALEDFSRQGSNPITIVGRTWDYFRAFHLKYDQKKMRQRILAGYQDILESNQ